MRAPQMVRDTPLHRAYEAYSAPHLTNEAYFSQEHRQKLLKESEIVHWVEYKDPLYEKGVGTFRYIGVTTAQGYEYGVLATEPETPYLQSDNVPIVGTPAWFTSHDGGFNEETITKLTRDGNYVWFLGTEGSYRSGLEPEPISAISLGSSAAATLSFSRDYAQVLKSQGHSIAERKRMTVGASKGGNTALGITMLAGDFEQDVIYTDVIAPRFPNRLTLATTPHLVGQVVTEGVRLVELPFRLGLKRSARYARGTLDLSSDQIAIGGAIMNGEAGYFADNIGREQLLDVLLLTRDGSHEHHVWQQKFWGHSEVEITPTKGIHMHIPLKQIQLALRDRIMAARECNRLGLSMSQENKQGLYEEFSSARHQGLKRNLGTRVLKEVG